MLFFVSDQASVSDFPRTCGNLGSGTRRALRLRAPARGSGRLHGVLGRSRGGDFVRRCRALVEGATGDPARGYRASPQPPTPHAPAAARISRSRPPLPPRRARRRPTRGPFAGSSASPPPRAREPRRGTRPTDLRLTLTPQAAKARLRDAGVTHLTPVQERTLRAIIVDRLDVLVQAPTGSGKTLAYLLPLTNALEEDRAASLTRPEDVRDDRLVGVRDDRPERPRTGGVRALIFLPTRELAAQVFEHAERHVTRAGFPCVLCCGGTDEKPAADAIRKGEASVIVGTPGRIKAFVDRGILKITDGLLFQILDECDRLLDGGFENDVESVCRPPGGSTRTACLSATMPLGLIRFLRKRLPADHAAVRLKNAAGGNVGGAVRHLAFACHDLNLHASIIEAIEAYAGGSTDAIDRSTPRNPDRVEGQAIVFVNTKVNAERLAGTLAVAYEVRRRFFFFFFLRVKR